MLDPAHHTLTPGELLTLALRSALESGNRPPCTGPAWRRWTSESADERAEAARLCGPCSITDACRAAADYHRERWGTWAGRDRTARKPRGAAPERPPEPFEPSEGYEHLKSAPGRVADWGHPLPLTQEA